MGLPRALVALTALAVVVAGCTDSSASPPKRKLEPRPLATAAPGQIVTVIGDGRHDTDWGAPAWAHPIQSPSALLEGDDNELLIAQSAPDAVVAVTPQGTVRALNGPRGVGGSFITGVHSLARLPDGTVAALTVGSWIVVQKVADDGTPTGAVSTPAPPGLAGFPSLAVDPSGTPLVLWAGRMWTLTGGALVESTPVVPGAVRAVADGPDLLVATNDTLHRVRAGKVVTSLPIRPAGQRWQRGSVTAVAPDGAGGAYIAVGEARDSLPDHGVKAGVLHVPAVGPPRPIAFGPPTPDCSAPVRSDAAGRAPLGRTEGAAGAR